VQQPLLRIRVQGVTVVQGAQMPASATAAPREAASEARTLVVSAPNPVCYEPSLAASSIPHASHVQLRQLTWLAKLACDDRSRVGTTMRRMSCNGSTSADRRLSDNCALGRLCLLSHPWTSVTGVGLRLVDGRGELRHMGASAARRHAGLRAPPCTGAQGPKRPLGCPTQCVLSLAACVMNLQPW